MTTADDHERETKADELALERGMWVLSLIVTVIMGAFLLYLLVIE